MNKNNNEYSKKHKGNATIDWDRVNLFYSLCKDSMRFSTPKPIRLNDHNSTIDYEYRNDISPVYLNLQSNPDSAEQLGRSLAAFHHDLKVDSCLSYSKIFLKSAGLSKTDINLILTALPISFLHGDCWHGNLFWDENQKLVLLDPIPNDYLIPKAPMHSCSCLDLATLIMGISVCHPISSLILIDKKNTKTVQDKILASYLDYYSATHLTKIIEKLTIFLAKKHIDAYRTRLIWPLDIIKTKFALKSTDHLNK